MLIYMKTRSTYNSCLTFLKPTKLDIQCIYVLFRLLGDFGKLGYLPNIVKTHFYTKKKLVIHITLVLHSLIRQNMTYNVLMAY